MNLQDLYGFSLYVGLASYVVLTVFCIVNWVRNITGRALLVVSAVTLAFIVSLLLNTPGALPHTLELVATLAGTLLLYRALEIDPRDFSVVRIREITLNLPPLRDRLGDAMLLATSFVDRYRDKPNLKLGSECLKSIDSY